MSLGLMCNATSSSRTPSPPVVARRPQEPAPQKRRPLIRARSLSSINDERIPSSATTTSVANRTSRMSRAVSSLDRCNSSPGDLRLQAVSSPRLMTGSLVEQRPEYACTSRIFGETFGKRQKQQKPALEAVDKLIEKHDSNVGQVAKGVLFQGAPKRKTMEIFCSSRSPYTETNEEASPKFPRVAAGVSSWATKGTAEEKYRKLLDDKLLRALVKRGVGPTCGDSECSVVEAH